MAKDPIQQVREFRAKYIEQTERIFRMALLDVFTGVVIMTPVDTGRAAASCSVSLAHPSRSMPMTFPTKTGTRPRPPGRSEGSLSSKKVPESSPLAKPNHQMAGRTLKSSGSTTKRERCRAMS